MSATSHDFPSLYAKLRAALVHPMLNIPLRITCHHTLNSRLHVSVGGGSVELEVPAKTDISDGSSSRPDLLDLDAYRSRK